MRRAHIAELAGGDFPAPNHARDLNRLRAHARQRLLQLGPLPRSWRVRKDRLVLRPLAHTLEASATVQDFHRVVPRAGQLATRVIGVPIGPKLGGVLARWGRSGRRSRRLRRTGMTIIGTPRCCRRCWIRNAVSLCRTRFQKVSSSKMSWPATTSAFGYFRLSSVPSCSASTATSVPTA